MSARPLYAIALRALGQVATRAAVYQTAARGIVQRRDGGDGGLLAVRCPGCLGLVVTRVWLRRSLSLRPEVAPGESPLACSDCDIPVEASADVVAEVARLDADYDRWRAAPAPEETAIRARLEALL